MGIRCAALGALSGSLYCLAFPDFGLWPLALLALVPLLQCVELAPTGSAALWGAALGGLIANLGRGYFLLETLQNFSALPIAVCALVTLLLCALQGGQLVLFVWLLRQARARGLQVGACAPVAFATTELVYPRIFHDYLANALHDQTHALQIVDLGGPGLLSMAIVLASGAVHELIGWSRRRRAFPRALTLAGAVTWVAVLLYGGYRIDEVERRMADAPHAVVGVAQANAGMFDKRKKRRKYYLRHHHSSRALEKEVQPDLLVWPETSVQRVRDTKKTHAGLSTPLLLGTVDRREVDGRSRKYNTALLTDADGKLVGRYDKRHLLPFGEYLPLEESVPALRSLSPRSGRFSAGQGHDALRVGPFRISALICYEDVVPALVRDAVRRGRPNLLANLTNDAWFGDTNAPWLHLALAKFRAVEHHRTLVRATNSGVSAIVDPLGRTIAQAKTFARARIHAEVALLDTDTLYSRVGDAPGALSLIATLAMFARRRRR